jgi:hypothetical protein
MQRRILLICGVLSSALYVVTDLLASWWYTGYSILDQNYSELLATGAPTRPAMLFVSIVYNLLVAAFAVGVWATPAPKHAARRTGAMMMMYAALSMVTPMFFQMDMRGAEMTPLGSLHPPMTGVMSVFIVASIGFGGFLLGKPFRWYSFGTIAALLVFGSLTALQAPQLAAGGATPWMGLTERINIYATMLWFALLSAMLLRLERGAITDGTGASSAVK